MRRISGSAHQAVCPSMKVKEQKVCGSFPAVNHLRLVWLQQLGANPLMVDFVEVVGVEPTSE